MAGARAGHAHVHGQVGVIVREARQQRHDALGREALGEHTFNAFIKNKKIEWDNYRTQVTDYEIKRSLPLL